MRNEKTFAASEYAARTGYCCGSSGAVAGGGVAVGSVGGEAGSKYQITSSPTTTAAAMISNLLVSIGWPHCCFAVED